MYFGMNAIIQLCYVHVSKDGRPLGKHKNWIKPTRNAIIWIYCIAQS